MIDIQDLSFFPALVVVLTPFLVITLAGMLLSGKLIKNSPLLESELRGLATISNITGALFGLMLGLIVVNLWQDYKHMQEKTVSEASEITVIYFQAKQLQNEDSDTLQSLIENYIVTIIEDGWPLMTKGKESMSTTKAFNKLSLFAIGIKAEGDGKQYIKKNILDKLYALYLLRKERLYYVTSPRISVQIWIVLCLGAVISISTTLLFPVSRLRIKTILTLAYSSMIGLIFFLIICLNYPFRGAISISPDAYIEALKSIKKIESIKLRSQ